MENKIKVINELLVNIFNDILMIEQRAVLSGKYKNLSITEMHTIEVIGIDKPKSMSKVASELDITVGTLTIAINNLVKKGYVERKKSENDRRVVKIALTENGVSAYKLHEKFHDEMVMSSIDGLSEEEKEVLVKSLDKLNVFFKEKYSLLK